MKSFALPLIFVLAVIGLLTTGSCAMANGEHYRRLTANLEVLRGDVRRLASANTTSIHRQGLRLRLQEKLGLLKLLVRYAKQETPGLPGGEMPGVFQLMQRQLHSAKLDSLDKELEQLAGKYPLRLTPILRSELSSAYFKQAEALHIRHCSGCHGGAFSQKILPAFNLFTQAGSMSRDEFVARLLVGLRGDHLTSLENPFTDWELSALTSYYRKGIPSGAE